MSDIMENYKGIMLCSRPQEQINLDYQRPFISRVHPDEKLGYNPVPKVNFHKPVQRKKPVYQKHRKWLDEFAEKMRQKKESESQPQQQTQPQPQKKKPEWALTENQVQEKKDQEVDDLLNFVKDLDYDQYINDLEVKIMLEALKKRVSELKENENVQDEVMDQMVENERQEKLSQQNSSQQKKQVKRFEPEKEWDQSVTGDPHKVSIEQRIAKHIANEILKKNKYLRGLHSNLSLRRVLEMEAQKELTK